MSLLVIDGVKYNLLVPKEERQLEEYVKKHYNEIFGKESFYFDIKPELRSKAGIGSKPDGIVVVFDKPSYYVIENERAEHGIHDHVITQISKFNTAFKKPETKKKIAEAVYNEILSDPSKEFLVKSKVKGELYKFLTDLFSETPVVAIIIDELLDELQEAVDELPIESKIIEFKTFVREDAPSVHAHLFKPIHAEKTIEKVRKTEVSSGETTPQPEYAIPLLESIIELGGSAKVSIVLNKIHEKMKDRLKPKDHEKTSSRGAIRWKNHAMWLRQSFVTEGYLKKNSPRGIWEITDEGRKYYETLKVKKN